MPPLLLPAAPPGATVGRVGAAAIPPPDAGESLDSEAQLSALRQKHSGLMKNEIGRDCFMTSDTCGRTLIAA
jgi:hypothetical protein